MCRLDSAIVFLIVQANYLLSLSRSASRERDFARLYDEQGWLTKHKSYFCEIC
jgi:hypothetical protein